MQQASYVHGANETALIGDTIGNHLDLIAEKYPNHPAVVVRHQNIRLTYAELKNRTDALAEGLLAIGLQPGERIGIWSPNNVEWLLTQFASAKAGLILVNINPAYRAHELKHVLAKVECAALILAPSLKTSDYIEILRSIVPEVDDARPGYLSAEQLPALRCVIRPGEERTSGMLISIKSQSPATLPRLNSDYSLQTSCNLTIPSTSSSPVAPQAAQKVRRSLITTSSIMVSSLARRCGSVNRTGCVFRFLSITASAWFWAIWPV